MTLRTSISVITPVFKAEECINELHKRLCLTLESLDVDFEIIMVNDCSPDNSWELITDLALKDNRVKAINLSRNFGQHYAITAGLSLSKYNWTVVMDCDLQDRPEEIPSLLNKALTGFDIVLGQRTNRRDNFLKRIFSQIFYATLAYLTGTKQDASVANFGIYHSKTIKAILSSKDNIRYFPTMVQWVGFKSTRIEVQHAPRSSGTSSYNFKKMLRLALDIILAYSDKPLRLTIKLGLMIAIVSFLFACLLIFKALNGQIIVSGYASLMVSIWFISGLLLSVMGIIGLYIGKIFEQVKGRPSFIISETINLT